MPSPKAVLADIHTNKLSPTIAHRHVGKKGHLLSKNSISVPQTPITHEAKLEQEVKNALVELETNVVLPDIKQGTKIDTQMIDELPVLEHEQNTKIDVSMLDVDVSEQTTHNTQEDQQTTVTDNLKKKKGKKDKQTLNNE